ncbi:substrate-binding domain-containing protein [Cognatishimia sp. MH4019]|uniref:substrate-binding domain-containing protein n=1 Tax=Cognatishimia sp. MH4019 TaxID=2854030 RepID=UPI001CD7F8E9|nr:substrate-binding domain-containing protein [Cognatishimia sp. MH4019]
MRILCAARVAALFLFWSSIAVAQTVTLSAQDGSLALEGRVLGFDGRYFRLETVYGEVTVDGDAMICAGGGCPTPSAPMIRVRISGAASATSVLLPALVEGFALRNGYAFARVTEDATHFSYTLVDGSDGTSLIDIGFRVSSSGEGFADLIVDEADLVASLRPIRPGEAQLEEEAGRGDLTQPGQAKVLALDAIVPVVSTESALTEITLPFLIAAFSDPQSKTPVHTLARGSGVVELFSDRALQTEGLSLAPQIVFHQTSAALKEALLGDPNAIGLIALSEASGLRTLTLSGSCPTPYDTLLTTLKSGDYPLVAPIYLYRPMRRLPPIMKDFMAYLETPAAQVVVQRAGFVDQAPDLIPLTAQGGRLAGAIEQAGAEVPLPELKNIVTALAGYQRLSLSLRFETDGETLTPISRAALDRFAKQIAQGAYAGRPLLVTGHTGLDGAFAESKDASLVLAETVRKALPATQEVEVLGAGDALPSACETTTLGRTQNHRVEIWVK